MINTFHLMCARSASSDLHRWLENFASLLASKLISVCFLIIFWCFRKFYSFRLSFSSFFQNFEFFVIFYRIQTGQKSLGIKKIWQPNQDRKILCWNSLWYPILKNKSSFIHFENLTNTCHLTCQVTGSKIPAFGPPRIFLHRECFASRGPSTSRQWRIANAPLVAPPQRTFDCVTAKHLNLLLFYL